MSFSLRRALGTAAATAVVIGLGAHPPAVRAAAPVPAPAITLYTDQLADPSFMGLGAEFDPYDSLSPSQVNWPLLTQRLDFMRPGILRVV
ncbi:MAG TPA: hypothetical protein VIJ20_09925 [Solirubrobacteraceae bacterium]